MHIVYSKLYGQDSNTTSDDKAALNQLPKKVAQSIESEAVDFYTPLQEWLDNPFRNPPADPNLTAAKLPRIAWGHPILQRISVVGAGVPLIQVDAIVNAANEKCHGGGGVDGAIHRAAGRLLVAECHSFAGCRIGHARITKGYDLPAKSVIHCVGPRGEQPAVLRQTIRNCLLLGERWGVRSIAFPLVSTGIFGYPLDRAVQVILGTIAEYLEEALRGVPLDMVTGTGLKQPLDVPAETVPIMASPSARTTYDVVAICAFTPEEQRVCRAATEALLTRYTSRSAVKPSEDTKAAAP